MGETISKKQIKELSNGVNAVAHRDYFFTGASIRVMIFDDRIEVESPGGLPEGVTLKNLEGSHVLRNERIANLLYDIGYIYPVNYWASF